MGFAFDGFPIYGPYDFGDSQSIERMRSSYQLRELTQRDNGPQVSAEYPLGAFLEDFEFIEGSGDLDSHNGHFGVTADYPDGIYHYHTTINQAENDGVYPFFIGPTYYGEADASNFITQITETGQDGTTTVQDTDTTSTNEDAPLAFHPVATSLLVTPYLLRRKMECNTARILKNI